MEDLLITANQLRALLKSAGRLGFAQGSKDPGNRTIEPVNYSNEAVVLGLIKTNQVKK